MTAWPYREISGGLEVFIRVTPKASANRLQGLIANAAGSARVKVQVTAVPEAGKANAAVIRLLSKAWKIPRSDFTVISGHTARNKTLLITGDSAALAAVLRQRMGL